MTFTKPPEAVRPQAPGNSTNILVVESDPGIQWSLERGLTHSGYQVHVTACPEEALALARTASIDAVFMEVMPQAGFTVDFLSRMVAARQAPTVLCSASDSS